MPVDRGGASLLTSCYSRARWALSEDHQNHHWWASANLKKKATGTGGPSLVSAYNVMTQVQPAFAQTPCRHPHRPRTLAGTPPPCPAAHRHTAPAMENCAETAFHAF